MIINRTAIVPKTTFRDLNLGDVFYFINKESNNDKIKIYMRCGSSDSDRYAVNLETGIFYSFDNNEQVHILKAYMELELTV